MKQLLIALMMMTPLLLNLALANNMQQNKMTSCNQSASGKQGEARKAFMQQCLSSKPAAAMTQQEKMKTCNLDASGKKGDERKAFMKQCLSKKMR